MKLSKIPIYKNLFYRIVFLAFPVVISIVSLRAQVTDLTIKDKNSTKTPAVENSAKNYEEDFRVEKVPVAGGAEIVTIFLKTHRTIELKNITQETPLVSVLRDTLGDETKENDILRHVWILTYTRPSFAQKFAAAVPFLYTRTTNKGKIGDSAPPPVIDLNPSQNAIWNKIFWRVFKSLILGDFGTPARAAAIQYKTNADNYRQSAIARALAVFVLYESIEGKKILSDTEMKDIQARMLLSNKLLGSLVQNENLERVYQTNAEETVDVRGHNWELLRQYTEAQGLYFDPLQMPDGSTTHALVWTTETDLRNNRDKKFDSRFLNIKSPWNDKRLDDWRGYSEVRWFDENNRQVAAETPNATPRQMIPLALYGLDYPKIPALLIDFRDRDNPKRREMSRRVLNDLTRNVFGVSQFAHIPYFVGRYFYSFVTGRRGVDINQPSRAASYSQLKLLLSLNESLEPQFRDELADRAEAVSINPLENDLDVESKLAQRQYDNLMEYAKRPDGLPKELEKNRREEMVRLKHGGKSRTVYSIGHLLSFGLYTHREKDTPEMRLALDMRRRLDYHERYLRETARDSVNPQIDGDIAALRDSLKFIAENGSQANKQTVEAITKIFSSTDDEQTRILCLRSLGKIDDPAAQKSLLAIYENQKIEQRWRILSAEYLHPEAKEKQDKMEEEKTALKTAQ